MDVLEVLVAWAFVLLPSWAAVYLHVAAFHAGDPSRGDGYRKALLGAVVGAVLGGAGLHFLSDVGSRPVGSAILAAFLGPEAPAAMASFGLPFGALVAALARRGRATARDQWHPQLTRVQELVHRWLPGVLLSAAALALFAKAMWLLMIQVSIGGGLAHGGFYPWVLPRFMVASLLATALAGFAIRTESSSWVRTSLLIGATGVEAFAALRWAEPV